MVCSTAKLSSDSKLQGLVNVNMKIRKCHPKMFCTYAGTNGESLGITPNNKKRKSGPEKFLFFARKTNLI